MKTGFRYLLSNNAITHIVTVDSDGQHLLKDVVQIFDTVKSYPNTFILGTRNFEEDIPFKSAMGNKLTKIMLRSIAGIDLKDTQTGLRALPRKLAEQSLSITSARYRFEIEIILLAKQLNFSFHETDISTVYIDGNRMSHFRPIRDSIDIYTVFFRFSAASFGSFGVDVSLFAFLYHYSNDVLFSTYIARILSGSFNFLCNRHFVFRRKYRRDLFQDAIAYLILAFLIATASGIGVRILSEWFDCTPVVVKLVVEPILFLASFSAQRCLIFKSNNTPK